jgi:hypothetical protein
MKCENCNHSIHLNRMKPHTRNVFFIFKICERCQNKLISPDYCTDCKTITIWSDRTDGKFECKYCHTNTSLKELMYCNKCKKLIGYEIGFSKKQKKNTQFFGDKHCINGLCH